MIDYYRGLMFASAAAKAEWQPKITLAQQTWNVLERESVRLGLRNSALLILPSPQELVSLSQWATDSNLVISILAVQPEGIRVVLTQQYLLREWQIAWRAGEPQNDRVGILLSFPACCRKFFDDTWTHRGFRDTTIVQATSGTTGHPGCSVLLRWIGVRLVPHLPCSFDCQPTGQLATQMLALGVKLGLTAGVSAILELLTLHTRYSSLHGLGEVRTPVFKFEFSTDYKPSEIVVLRNSQEFKLPEPPEPSSYEDNGFTSYESMSLAHALVLTASEYLNGAVVDLGCGDGTLLSKLAVRNSLSAAIGVEIDPVKVSRGQRRHGSLVRFAEGSILAFLMNPLMLKSVDSALLMPGRLLELSDDDRASAVYALKKMKKILVYTYGDWGELEKLCETAGLPKPRIILKNSHAEAGVISCS